MAHNNNIVVKDFDDDEDDHGDIESIDSCRDFIHFHECVTDVDFTGEDYAHNYGWSGPEKYVKYIKSRNSSS